MMLRGVVGGFLRVVAGVYLIYFSGLFEGLLGAIAAGFGGVEGAGSVGEIVSALWLVGDGVIGSLRGVFWGVVASALLWIVGGFLLNSAWGRLSRLWPGWVRLLFRVLELLFTFLFLAALLYPVKVLSLVAGHVGFLGLLPLARYVVVFYLLPLTIPVLKALATLYYSTERQSRIGVSLLVLGGLFYLYTAYLAYTAFNPVREIVSHLEEAAWDQGLDRAKDIALAGLGAARVLVERTRLIVSALTTASIAYTVAFILFKEDVGIIAGARNIFRIRKKKPKDKARGIR
ncbi:MAG: hypothetical protein GSR86_05995 [Desulfurococcales archaeon]|nr:hypothetical protein [Desulfurococcales archaeon]